jgi:hypothetical protein
VQQDLPLEDDFDVHELNLDDDQDNIEQVPQNIHPPEEEFQQVPQNLLSFLLSKNE